MPFFLRRIRPQYEKWRFSVNSTTVIFVRMFLAALFLQGADEIPFSGDSYTSGVTAVRDTLLTTLPEEQYDEISDMFVKTPVQEEYILLRNGLFALNRDVISIPYPYDPSCTRLKIRMTPYHAGKILQEDTGIGRSLTIRCAKVFCEAADCV